MHGWGQVSAIKLREGARLMSDSVPALEIKNLCKTFERPAVDNLTLSIEAGQIYALLGPNGAGKTTTLKMVAGLLKPDAGEIYVCGTDCLRDPTAAKQIMAWVPDEPLIYDRLTPFEYLEFVAGLWGMDYLTATQEAEKIIDYLALTPYAHDQCQGLSKGMRQKVALAGALIHRPRLIILDEPLTGLDAGSARQVKSVLQERLHDGATIIMTTHILDVAERMAERIGVISNGRLIAEGTFDDLRQRSGLTKNSLEDVFLNLVASQDHAA